MGYEPSNRSVFTVQFAVLRYEDHEELLSGAHGRERIIRLDSSAIFCRAEVKIRGLLMYG